MNFVGTSANWILFAWCGHLIDKPGSVFIHKFMFEKYTFGVYPNLIPNKYDETMNFGTYINVLDHS